MQHQQPHPQQFQLPLSIGAMPLPKVLAQPERRDAHKLHDIPIRAALNRTYKDTKLPVGERAERYLKENPLVYSKFCIFAWQLINAGETRIGAKMVAERLRWDSIISKSSTDPYAVNNSYISFMARRFMKENPQVGEVFETREKAAAALGITIPWCGWKSLRR